MTRKTWTIIGVAVLLLVVAVCAVFILQDDDSDDATGASPTTTTIVTPTTVAVPIPTESCAEVTRRKREAAEVNRQAMEDANLARDTAIANVEDPKDIQSATAAANKAHAKAVKDANKTYVLTLESLADNDQLCATFTTTTQS